MDHARSERWGAASGLVVLAIGAAAIVFERGAPSGESTEALTDFYSRNGDALQWQSFFFLINTGIFLWFLGTLRTYLARFEGGAAGVSNLVFGSGVAWTAVSVAAQAAQVGVARGAHGEIEPAVVEFMTALFIGANLLVAVMLFAVAAVSLGTGAFPPWLARLSLISAVANVVPLFGVVVENGPLASDGWATIYAPYPVFVLWLVCTIIVMLRRVGRPLPTN